MLRERETGDFWEVIEHRNHLLVIKRANDGLLRTIVAELAERDYQLTCTA
jgi:hypothetical protein